MKAAGSRPVICALYYFLHIAPPGMISHQVVSWAYFDRLASGLSRSVTFPPSRYCVKDRDNRGLRQ